MGTSKSSLHLRIIIMAFLIGIFLVIVTAYDCYAQEVKQHVSEKVVELFPDMEEGLAVR